MEEFFARTLVFSPHCDDEILGCGGLICRTLSEVPLSVVRVVVVGTGDVINKSNGISVTALDREKEFMSAMEYLKGASKSMNTGSGTLEYEVLYPGFELKLQQDIGMTRMVQDFDRILDEFNPTAVLTCYPSHHQDHKIVCEAAIASMRPSPVSNIPLRAMYEYGYHEAWNPMNQVKMGKFYVDISPFMDIKIESFKYYTSQQREEPADLLSLESIRAHARFRGMECGALYAEAFFPLSTIWSFN